MVKEMNTKDKGDISEAVVAAQFLKMGIPVAKPFGDNQSYDLIIDFKGDLKKVQIKTARFKGDVIKIPTCNSVNTYFDKKLRRKNYKGKVDFIVGYCSNNDTCYVLNVEAVGNTQVDLRLEKPLNKQSKGVRYAEDYLLTYSLMEKYLTDIQVSEGSIPSMSTFKEI